MLKLPTAPQSDLGVQPINWGNLPKRYMNPGELEVLAALVRSVHPRTMIEIGCNEGRTAKALLNNVDGIENYVGIDVPPGYVFAKQVQRKEVPLKPGHLASDDARFRLILSERGSFDLSATDLPKCDAIFIDGDHGQEAVMHDTWLAHSLVRSGGIIVYHDYHDLGTVDVRDCLHELVDAGHDIKHVEGTWLAFERVP